MKGWVPLVVVMEAIKSPGLRGYLSRTYNQSVPCTLHLGKTVLYDDAVWVSVTQPGWSRCEFMVPLDAVSVEVKMKSTSLPLRDFMRLRQYFAGRTDEPHQLRRG